MLAPGAGGPSGLLLNVIVPEGDGGERHEDDDILSFEVPLHARYGVPRTKTDGELIDEVVLPPPEALCNGPACAEGHVDGGGDGIGALGGASQISVPGSDLSHCRICTPT